ncbi:efflux RND transporter periplasmic adaptor subunit [Paenibacillus piscarius]|uniref:efflux RND transporter periplasmic adaptor subunit n=1 Tax=Paenibacillus piscarius TaxID=1089681 RepID=UPI001EE786F5|nr:RND transporter [Paenibacillus piscarius]
MESTELSAHGRRQKKIRTAALLLLGVLLFFTFFSNTLESLTLPKVTTVEPVNRRLELTLEAGGMLRPVSEAKLLNASGWKVRQFLVQEGERVKKGQTLLLYDSGPAEREVEDAVSLLEKQKIEQQTLQDQFIQTYMEGDELQIRKARRDIEAGKLEQARQAGIIAGMRERLAREQQLKAPFDGIVTKLNAMEGMLSAGEPEVILTSSSQGVQFDFTADAELLTGLGVSVGEPLEVEIVASEGQPARSIPGKVAEIKNAQALTDSLSGGEDSKAGDISRREVLVKLKDASLKGGEQVQVRLKKLSLQEGLVVPNQAIHQVGGRSFVYKIEEQRGALGNAFVAREVQIRSSRTNGAESLIETDSLYEDEMIILESSEPLQDGNRVRLQ